MAIQLFSIIIYSIQQLEEWIKVSSTKRTLISTEGVNNFIIYKMQNE